jgi:hypothetical protein
MYMSAEPLGDEHSWSGNREVSLVDAVTRS